MPSEEHEFADDAPVELATVLRFPSNPLHTERDQSEPDTAAPLRSVIGEVLRDERHTQQRTLADVAGDAAVSLAYLSEIERGRKEISSDLLAAVGDALDLSLVEILERCVDRLRAQGGSGIQLLAA